MKTNTLKVVSFIVYLLVISSCSQKKEDEAVIAVPRYLYFSSGGCYVGTLVASKPASTTSSGLINRVLLDSGQIQGVPIFDYFQSGLNLWPVGIVNLDNDYMLVNVMTATTGFRVDKVKKAGLQSKSDYFSDITNLASALRSITLQTDGSVMISRSTMIEKYNSSLVRVTNPLGSASFISNPGGTCASSNTLISGMISLPNSNVFYTHAGGATNNRVGVIEKNGYGVVGDCKSAITFSGTPATVAVPTAAVLVPGTDPYQIIVATTSSTVGNDQLQLFTVNSTTSTITYVKSLYNDMTLVRGVSAMTYDTVTNSIYVANGSTSLGNTVEKFSYDPAAQVLTRTGTFLGLNADNQCINSMFTGY